ncbi:hypothetical protein, partial [Pseudoteredinibacter isoporae]|uniref:hypothetical protein n=1 Tax=Pseudoteredinibacter isoporae TaxID=570281 RepID=UPI003340A5C3
MPIQDDNVSRRNLVLWSGAIIVFYFGGGSLDGDKISLSLLSLELSSPDQIIWVPWVILLWFAYRFHLTHRDRFTKEWKKGIWDSPKSEKFGKAIYAKVHEKVKSSGSIILSRDLGGVSNEGEDVFKIVGVQANWSSGTAFYGKRSAGWEEYDVEIGGRSDNGVELPASLSRRIMLAYIQEPFTSYLAPHLLWLT